MLDFENIAARIQAANEYYQHSEKRIIPQVYTKDKIFEGSRIYHNTGSVNKSQKITERELKRPWQRLSIKYKTLAVLNFLREFEEKYPKVDLNLVRYETIMYIDANNTDLLRVSYDCDVGKIINIYGYQLDGNKVIKSNDFVHHLGNKPIISLKFKEDAPPISE